MQKTSFFLTTSFRICHKGLLGLCFLYFSLVADTHADCPLQINPRSVVVRYGDSASANCSTSVQHGGMGWEANRGGVPNTPEVSLITWRVSNLTDWNIEAPICFINFNNGSQCQLSLPVTVYKTPDSVSISSWTHTGPMIEGHQYELQCDVHNVAPQNLTVRWYKGQTLVNQTSFTDTIRTSVSINTKLRIKPVRSDDGVQYSCEAQLDLGEEGPQPPLSFTSDPLNITVHYKPTINETKLPLEVTLLRGYSMKLVCEAQGNPEPTINWSVGPSHNGALNITESTPEIINCTASNYVGSTTREVKVIIKENYTLLIVLITLAALVFILIISIYIFCTYYKKSRMGHYNLKKPNASKGLLAEPTQSP